MSVDNALVAVEGDAVGDGTNWENFDSVSINDSGNYLFSGDTTGATDSDEFIAYDARVALREGDILDGVLLEPGTVRALSINNLGQAVHIWSANGGREHLFFVSDAWS